MTCYTEVVDGCRRTQHYTIALSRDGKFMFEGVKWDTLGRCPGCVSQSACVLKKEDALSILLLPLLKVEY